jgi:hypothetical protein
MKIVVSLLAATLLARALFLAVMTWKFRDRAGHRIAAVHAGLLGIAGLFAGVAAAQMQLAIYFVPACGLALLADALARSFGRRPPKTSVNP